MFFKEIKMAVSKSTLVNSTRQKDTLTENGAVTNSTTLSDVLNLFFLAGASRNLSEIDIENLIRKAMVEDELSTLKVIFWAGDIRGGAGERRFFKVALKTLSEFYPAIFAKNFALAPEFNRFDSLFDFYEDEQVLSYLFNTLTVHNNGLLAKWMPREGKVKNQDFRKAFLKFSGMKSKAYRKLLSKLSETLETNLSNKDYSFEYSHVPSVAFNKYRKAFYRNDEARITDFIGKVESGEEKINAGAIFPHDLYRSYARGDNSASINAQWSQLPNYMEGSDEKILPIVDVSYSMNGMPMDVAISLGTYISERNTSIFKDAFITFHERPTMHYLQGTTTERFSFLQRAPWGGCTNLHATFDLVLNSAVSNNLPQSDMPTKLLVISDMEFDHAEGYHNSNTTNFEVIKEKYEQSGYKMPDLVFWNVDGRSTDNFPVSFNEDGVALVSGASPSILKSVLNGTLNPMTVLNDTINSERYSALKV